MYIAKIPKKTKNKIHMSYLLRESYREKGKVKQRTIANISRLPQEMIEQIGQLLKGGRVVNFEDESFLKQKQGKAYGAIKVVYEIAKRLGIEKAFGKGRKGLLALIMIAGIIISRRKSKNYIAQHWSKDEALKEVFALKRYFNEDDMYETLKWLSQEQGRIEKELWGRRKIEAKGKPLFLYDITSSYVEGEKNELAEYGYNRDKKQGKKQIVIGMITAETGEPISVEVFKGSVHDNATVAEQLKKMKEEFGIKEVVFVGDKGMLKSEQIEKITGEKWHYITTITKPQIKKLMSDGVFQYELFDEELCEIEEGGAEGVRYILRKNPYRAQEIKTELEKKIGWFTKKIEKQNKYLAEHPRAKAEIALKNLKDLQKQRKLEKLIKIEEVEGKIKWTRKEEEIEEYLKLGGCYVMKTNVPQEMLNKEEVHEKYKALAKIESDFRTLKTGFLEVRPIFVRKEEQVRGHVFACMLALKITHYMEQVLKPLNLPVAAIIETLDKIQYREITLFDKSTVKSLPNTYNKRQTQILKLLDIHLPVSL